MSLVYSYTVQYSYILLVHVCPTSYSKLVKCYIKPTISQIQLCVAGK